MSVLLYLLAVGSAFVGLAGREDVRLTEGLLAFAGVSHATFALGLMQPGIMAIPVGTVALWGLAGWRHFGR